MGVGQHSFHIIVITKITLHIELGKEISYKPTRHQNLNAKQATEQQKEIEIKIEKIKLIPQ